ncbi:hypothetical protein D9756_010252 [Leucocoprinus leucothites]|uniref:3-oxoacyl-[acyl-carrier-protein] reductase n=1 Tax=Leucocoprinus leucothites TaxID=201217 RepID=A0A8H5CTR9_9AGAR|nr:hypothetical protein D9756_010252 [Leucoagaricus leucothites]
MMRLRVNNKKAPIRSIASPSYLSAMTSQDSKSLKGKLALITGCTGGIGYATAIALGRLGCSIAVHYNSAEAKANELVKELEANHPDVKAVAFQADLSGYEGVKKLHGDVVRVLGHPDVLFNNAGVLGGAIGPNGNIQDVSVETFETTWRTNTGTAFLMTQLCLPSMEERKWGRIVFNSRLSLNPKVSFEAFALKQVLPRYVGTGGVVGPHYASSKSAMHGLLHWIASRYAKDGITCNAVAPALIVETTMMANPSEELGPPECWDWAVTEIDVLEETNSYRSIWTPS